jgi:dihydrolipoyl dehydrogenase
MNRKRHDLVVIGAGPGGYVAAIRAAQLGFNTACVEREAALGGTCLRIGCIPSKTLLESSERFWSLDHDLKSRGIQAAKARLNLPALLQRKDSVVATLTKGVEALFKGNKVTRYHGQGSLLAPGRIRVKGKRGTIELEAAYILIATGSKPASLPGVEWKRDRIGTSTEALSYGAVPKHLVVIGAGYIGLELGSIWSRFGSRVTVLEYLDRILPGMDAELASEAQALLEKQGLNFHLGAKVTSARVQGRQCLVEREEGKPIRCDRVLVAVGRRPNTDGLGLESVGIQPDEGGRIPVGQNFTTTAEGIYAIGDVIAGPMLAHKAEEEGIACVEALATGHGHVNYDAIPGVVYTHPEMAAVGKTEEQLRQAGVNYRKGVFPFRGNGRALALGATEGKVKILAHARTDRVLGVHILGARAGELINEAAAAMAFGASSEDLARTCHAHPTLNEAIKEAALAVDGRALHWLNPTRTNS